MSPVSTYDVLYHGMSDQDRDRLESELQEVLKKASAEAVEQLILGVQKAATAAYGGLLVNPWPDLIRENSGNYGFISAMLEELWQKMLRSDVPDAGHYQVEALVDAWQKRNPEKWAACVGHVAEKRIKQLEESLEFERKMNRRGV